MTSPQDPPIVAPDPTVAELARLRALIAQPDDAEPYTDAELTTLMKTVLCVTPKIDPVTRLPRVDARLLGLVDVHLDIYGAAALLWEDKAILAQAGESGTGGVVKQEATGQNSVSYADGSGGSSSMWALAQRMRRRSCNPTLTKAKTVTLLPPSDSRGFTSGLGGLDFVTTDTLADEGVPIGITDPAVINGPPLGE